MTIKKKVLTLFVSSLVILNLSLAFTSAPSFSDEIKAYKTVNALELVNKPDTFINAPIKIEASFDKFSNMGLDYKPAFKDSKKYISFLIRRPDIQKNVIPLSELKLMILRDKAEKLIDLESGDKIEITGTVFSTALNDPWVNVDNIKVIESKKIKNAENKANAVKILDTKNKKDVKK